MSDNLDEYVKDLDPETAQAAKIAASIMLDPEYQDVDPAIMVNALAIVQGNLLGRYPYFLKDQQIKNMVKLIDRIWADVQLTGDVVKNSKS